MAQVVVAVLAHLEDLASYAMKLTRDTHAADDLTQDTLFKALVNSSTFIGGTDVRPWLFTIMRNLFITNCRRRAVEKKFCGRSHAGLISRDQISTEDSAACRIELKGIQLAIGRMPDIFRIPIQLYCEGYKYHEIASLTATTVGTTKSRIYSARQLLRKNALQYGNA